MARSLGSDLRPEPPEWALAGGLPAPRETENFIQYTTRIGLDPKDLLFELTPQTLSLANVRLASALCRELPFIWQEHCRIRRQAAV